MSTAVIDSGNCCGVCVLCALAEEAKAVINVFSKKCNVEFEKRFSKSTKCEYRYAIIHNNKAQPLKICVSWLPDKGGLETALYFKPIIKELRPYFAAMTGICAGDKRKVNLGDIIVAERAFFYDTGKFIKDEYGRELYQHDTKTHQPSGNMVQYARMFEGWRSVIEALQRPISKHQQQDWILDKLLDDSTPRVSDIQLEDLIKHAPDWKK